MRKLSALLAIAGLATIAAPAFAQDNPPKDATKGVYVTAGAGGSWASNASTTYNNPTFSQGGTIYGSSGTTKGDIPLGGGVAVEAGIGYDFGNSIRSELTYLYNNGSISASTLTLDATSGGTRYTGTLNPNTSGTFSTNSVMLSGYYDIQTKTKFTPYVGAGIGYTSVTLPSQNRVTGTYTVNGSSGTGWIDYGGGSGSAFGYQAKVGVSYALSKPADVYVEGTYQGNTGTTINNLQLSALNLFGVRAGFRYRFGR